MMRSRLAISACLVLLVSCVCGATEARARSPRGAAKGGRPAGKIVDVRAALKRETRNFTSNGTLDETLRKIAKMAGVSVAIDRRALMAAGVVAGKKLRIVAKKARLEQLLDLALAKASPRRKPLAWSVRSGVVIVTTQKRLLSGRRQQVMRGRLRSPSTLKGVNFEAVELVDVIGYLRELTKLNFHTNWRALEAAGVTRQTLVTLRLSKVSAATVLDYVTEQISTSTDKFERIHWVFDGGIVRISTGSALNTGLRTKTFDLGAMLHAPISVEMPQGGSQLGRGRGGRGSRGGSDSGRGGGGAQGGRGSSRSGGSSVGGVGDPASEKIKQDIIDLIKSTVGQDMWQDFEQGKGSIKVIGNRLIHFPDPPWLQAAGQGPAATRPQAMSSHNVGPNMGKCPPPDARWDRMY